MHTNARVSADIEKRNAFDLTGFWASTVNLLVVGSSPTGPTKPLVLDNFRQLFQQIIIEDFGQVSPPYNDLSFTPAVPRPRPSIDAGNPRNTMNTSNPPANPDLAPDRCFER
jgi:hypothetical protein